MITLYNLSVKAGYRGCSSVDSWTVRSSALTDVTDRETDRQTERSSDEITAACTALCRSVAATSWSSCAQTLRRHMIV